MKMLVIFALVLAILSIFIPIGGFIIALITSFFALICFRSQSILSSITISINLIITAFFFPSLMTNTADVIIERTGNYHTYLFCIGWHLVCLGLGLILCLLKRTESNPS